MNDKLTKLDFQPQIQILYILILVIILISYQVFFRYRFIKQNMKSLISPQ